MDLMEALYEHHPIRVSVAGTAESISHITADTLYACHKAFYDPSNMVLCVAGDVDPEQMLPGGPGDPARSRPGTDRRGTTARRSPTEVRQARDGAADGGLHPHVPAGLQGRRRPGRARSGLRQQLLGELACEALLGNSSSAVCQALPGGADQPELLLRV